ncbi:MAG: OPT/YSL family transporter, partial [Limisphaera sp.]
ARWAALVGGVLGLVLEGVRLITKGRFWLSPVGLGLATVIPFNTCLAMFLGAFVFWLAERWIRRETSPAHRLIVQNQEPICGGVIAGGALMGIAVILLENFVLNPR